MPAIGFLETSGRLGAVVATDIALKAASVKLISLRKASGGLVTLIIEGEVAAVQAAINSAKVEAQMLCWYVKTNVIPRPSDDILVYIKELR
ncbi:MAG: BMC domain-containing protein [Candidatus Hodarchaeales archaeon]